MAPARAWDAVLHAARPALRRTRAIAALLPGALLAACQGGGASDSESEKVVNVYNWVDYIGEDTLARFEAETGIHVVYDVFDSNDVLEAKLLSGAAGYDVVVPTSDFLGRQIIAGVFQPLDKARLGNYHNLDPELLQRLQKLDPANAHGVPYLWGTNGIGYNVDKVRAVLGDSAPVDSLDLVFRPEFMRRLASCGVAFVDSPREVFPVVLHYLGLDPNSRDIEVYRQQAQGLLMSVRPYIRYFSSSQYINDLASGEICVAYGYSGDMFQARERATEARNGIRIEYSIPREGTMMWFDLLAIPAGARHLANAHRFIDFLLRPDVIAGVTHHVKYANPNLAALPLVDADIRNNTNIYPTSVVRERLFSLQIAPPKVDRVATRVWTAVKTGQ
jgi:putrescine transport system substrate-binding protein